MSVLLDLPNLSRAIPLEVVIPVLVAGRLCKTIRIAVFANIENGIGLEARKTSGIVIVGNV
jgi:hypothetical protein